MFLAIGMMEKDGLFVFARPFNCYSCLDLYWSDLCIRSQRVPGFLGCFLVMKIDFMTALAAKAQRMRSEPLSGAFCSWIHTLLYLLHPHEIR